MMTITEKIALAEKNIKQALDDYWMHVNDKEIYNNIEKGFIKRLAHDNAIAKEKLRALFRKSPGWNEELDAIIINGTRTHDPNPLKIIVLGVEIISELIVRASREGNGRRINLLRDCVRYFALKKDADKAEVEQCLKAINEIAPDAYAPRKKPSRIFKAICEELGIVDERAGSKFQKLYAQFADELSTKKIDFKLYLSLNPAHFLTMSNPKEDMRGETLVSCHSLNDTENDYNCGCIGYARDDITFIVFTAADPKNPENLNNRKTTRQLFMYKPRSGVLLQSRLYNTSGGTRGKQELSTVYRNLVQKELSDLEGMPNLWKKQDYVENSYGIDFGIGTGFGGYVDWIYPNSGATVSVRNGWNEGCKFFFVGTKGLCIQCGEQTSNGLRCLDCEAEKRYVCGFCDSEVESEADLTLAHGQTSDYYVCDECLKNHFWWCESCGQYYISDIMREVEDYDYVCPDCLDELYSQCKKCGTWVKKEDIIKQKDANGNIVHVCKHCA